MRHVFWLFFGWLGVVLCCAVGSRLVVGHVIPDLAIITVVFLALRREPMTLALSAVVLGYLVGRQALAPTGLHEVALVSCAITIYALSGRIAGSGAIFFGALTTVTLMLYHLILFGLLISFRGRAGFASLATTLVIPSAIATGLLAFLLYPAMNALEKRLSPEPHEGLTWR